MRAMTSEKTILITGSNGFIGSACREYFNSKGFKVFGIDVFGKGENIIQGEVSCKNLEKFGVKFDCIIHLAGSSTVGMAAKNPEEEREKTVGSMREVLEFMRHHGCHTKLVYASSAAIYGDGGNRHKGEISENDPLLPISEYGKHKLEAESLCGEYNSKYGVNVSIIRFFSIYGEGLKKQLLWDFSNRLKEADECVNCFGTGEEIRDFIHVKDATRFFELVLAKNEPEIYNCGSGCATPVKEILNKICKNFECEKELVFDNIIQEGNPECLLADISKARAIGFLPEISIDEGIKRYVRWFREGDQNRLFSQAELGLARRNKLL